MKPSIGVNPASGTPEKSWIQNEKGIEKTELPLESGDKSGMDELENQIVFGIEKIVGKKLK